MIVLYNCVTGVQVLYQLGCTGGTAVPYHVFVYSVVMSTQYQTNNYGSVWSSIPHGTIIVFDRFRDTAVISMI